MRCALWPWGCADEDGDDGVDDADDEGDPVDDCAAVGGGVQATAFKAFFSTTTESAVARLGTITAGPWVRPDGVQVAANAADLGAGKLLAPLNATAAKAYISTNSAWTGGATAPGTTAASAQDACTNWGAATGTGVTGTPCTTKPTFWDRTNVTSCGSGQRLYCFQP